MKPSKQKKQSAEKLNPRPWVPKTAHGRKLVRLRKKWLAAGGKLMTMDEVRMEVISRRAGFDLPSDATDLLLIPSWVSTAKERCYLPRDLSLTAKGTQKEWRLKMSAMGVVKLPRELLEMAGVWEADELRVCVGFIPRIGTASNAEGNAMVIRVKPYNATPAQIAKAEQQALRELRAETKVRGKNRGAKAKGAKGLAAFLSKQKASLPQIQRHVLPFK